MAHVGNVTLRPFPRDVYENGSVIEKGAKLREVSFRIAAPKASSKHVGLAALLRINRKRGR